MDIPETRKKYQKTFFGFEIIWFEYAALKTRFNL